MPKQRNDDPQCDHDRSVVIVTNQPNAYDSARPHRGTWVCGRRACVMDAMAWVERGTGERAHWRVGTDSTGHPWNTETPALNELKEA